MNCAYCKNKATHKERVGIKGIPLCDSSKCHLEYSLEIGTDINLINKI